MSRGKLAAFAKIWSVVHPGGPLRVQGAHRKGGESPKWLPTAAYTCPDEARRAADYDNADLRCGNEAGSFTSVQRNAVGRLGTADVGRRLARGPDDRPSVIRGAAVRHLLCAKDEQRQISSGNFSDLTIGQSDQILIGSDFQDIEVYSTVKFDRFAAVQDAQARAVPHRESAKLGDDALVPLAIPLDQVATAGVDEAN
jgi:hypothetical protein